MVKINSEELNIAGSTVAQYLIEIKCDTKYIAVELNGDILPKSQYENTVLKDDDCVEIVCFVGGG